MVRKKHKMRSKIIKEAIGLEGLILNEEAKYVTYLAPIFETIGEDTMRSLNWRLTYVETGGSLTKEYSFGDCLEEWISGDDLWDEIMKYPDIQWWWGLLQGFSKEYSSEHSKKYGLVDIKMDEEIWKNPVSMRHPDASIEIEAFDSSLSIVIAKDEDVLRKLKERNKRYQLLSELNDVLEE